MSYLPWIALAAFYLVLFAFVWCACVLAGRADDLSEDCARRAGIDPD